MTNQTPRLALPYLMPSQAQKHVTHNEALSALDAIIHISVIDRDLATPPVSPAAAACYIIAEVATDDWAGQEGNLAVFQNGGWVFYSPAEGWQAWIEDEQTLLVFDGSTWQAVAVSGGAMFGINATPDPTNRLAVASDASLLTHAGSGHQVKVNKAGSGDTASLLFQSNWSGHAEMGLSGDNAFSIKVSSDGTSWYETFRADPDTNAINLAPAGTARLQLYDTELQVDVPVTGTAVQSSATDDTPGRLMQIGAFGLGATDASIVRLEDGQLDLPSGFYSGKGGGADIATFPDSSSRYRPFLNLTRRIASGDYSQIRMFFSADAVTVMEKGNLTDTWGQEHRLVSLENLLGTVSEAAGVPTGAVIERGSNANGEYVRFADGTQICSREAEVDVTSTSNQTFSFAAIFAAVPTMSVNHKDSAPNAALLYDNFRGLTPSTTAFGVRLLSAGTSSDPTADTEKLALTAFGRWF